MTEPVRLRPATLADSAAIAALEVEVFGADAWSTVAVEAELTAPRRTSVVACDGDGVVLGYALSALGPDVRDLQRIAVAERHRRSGVGRRLLAAVTGGSVDRVLLEVSAENHAALRFYAQAGFEEIARRPGYYRDGSAAVVMARGGDG